MSAEATPVKAKPKRRRTQGERREETQSRVLDATIECLAEMGYARTTTTRIAQRAGVSRGALLHYYASKAELLTRAVEYIFERRDEDFRRAFSELPEGTDRGAAAIDLLWEMFRGSTFSAWLELLVAARGDEALRADVARITNTFVANVQATYHELFKSPPGKSPLFDLAPAFTFALLQGLALDRITSQDDVKATKVIDMMKMLERMVIQPSLA